MFGGAKYSAPEERAVFVIAVVCFGTFGGNPCSGIAAALVAYRIFVFGENHRKGTDARFFDTHEFFMLVDQYP